MPMEIISKIAITKSFNIPLFLMVFKGFKNEIKDESFDQYDEAPGDNFPYVVMTYQKPGKIR